MKLSTNIKEIIGERKGKDWIYFDIIIRKLLKVY
jgi:hypothetical protein